MSKKRKIPISASMPPVPMGFISQMETLLGKEEAIRLIGTLDESPSVSIRINRKKVADPEAFIRRFAEYGVSPVEWCESGFYLDNRPDFVHDPLFHAGTYYVQEAASMIYESIVAGWLSTLEETDISLRVLDLCAAPGGKSTSILNALKGNYILIANEYDSKRARILKENLDKWGDPNVIITHSPTSRFRKLEDFFDIVAVDAPCSGEGMMRREPVARSQWSYSLVDQCSALQKDILADAITALKPGGLLIYSTCTFNENENERNVEWLLQEYCLEAVETPRHFFPHRERCEGLFVAAFRKSGELSGSNVSVRDLSARLKKADIKLVSIGTEKFVCKGNLEVPSSRMVLSHDYDKASYPDIDISWENALSYLRRHPLILPPETPMGYVSVSFEGYPLGLVKNLGPRANNLYPAEWRILK